MSHAKLLTLQYAQLTHSMLLLAKFPNARLVVLKFLVVFRSIIIGMQLPLSNVKLAVLSFLVSFQSTNFDSDLLSWKTCLHVLVSRM